MAETGENGGENAGTGRAAQAAAAGDDGLLRTDGYGYGWYIGSLLGEHPVAYHTGDNPGFAAVSAWFPRDQVRLILLSNDDTTDTTSMLPGLIAAAFPGLAAAHG